MPMLARCFASLLSAAAFAVCCGFPAAKASPAAETDCLVRDPSTMIKEGSTYWIYGTGTGIRQFSSTDRMHWTDRGPVFPKAPDWVAATVPGNKDNNAWAPDIRMINGKYCLYYTYSEYGTNISGIGVAVNNSLDPKGWVDRGIVISSGKGADYNALDPCIFEDGSGGWWMSFGSYFGGIKLVRIDPKTGKRAADDRNIYPIAAHPQSSINAIEASAVYYHDGRYYLFVNWDACCAGSRSTYNIRMGRSVSATGPYLDKEGKDMLQGGGTPFLGSLPDFGSGLPFDDEVGPGHAGILKDGDGYWLTCHYEWARDRSGATTVNVFKLTWDAQGWPSVPQLPHSDPITPDLTYKIVNETSGFNLYAAGSDLVQESDDGTRPSIWRVGRAGDGYYSIASEDNGLFVSSAAGSRPGDSIVLVRDAKQPEAQWKLEPDGQGCFKLTNKANGQCLDDPGGSRQNGRKIGQWTDNGLPPQRWRFLAQADDQGIVPNATYRLSTAAGGLCLDVPGASHNALEKIGLWTDNGLLPQRWQIGPAKRGEYTIKSQESGLYMTAHADGGGSSGFVYQAAESKRAEQQWKIRRTADGAFTILNAGTGLSLTAPGNPPAAGAKAALERAVKNKSQAWVVVRE